MKSNWTQLYYWNSSYELIIFSSLNIF
jgi:hypothetical protein